MIPDATINNNLLQLHQKYICKMRKISWLKFCLCPFINAADLMKVYIMAKTLLFFYTFKGRPISIFA